MNHKALKKFIFLVAAGVISLGALFVASYQLYVFTDSTAFCGILCHKVMYPEYTTYQASPHSRVLCSSCHVGPGATYLVRSKIRGIPQLFATLFNYYPKPITSPVADLRPAMGTCEQCHRPEFFTGDMVKTNTTFNTDAANTRVDNTLVMRVGGGVPGVASGIHWHIASKIWYLPMDEARQEIAWVGVETAEGKLTEYTNQAFSGQLTQARIDQEKRLMDCVDCHNRATHIFQSPERLIDAALLDGRIEVTLPFVKKEALSRLSPLSPTLAEANSRVETIKDFYRNSYPQIYNSRQTSVNNLVAVMKDIVTLTVFPDMKVTYQTHINNLGHTNSAGCFRCHQESVVQTSTSVDISSECNTCHYARNASPSAQPPAIQHTLIGRSDCLSCHGSTGTFPVPASHAGRANSTCTSCHVAGTIEPTLPVVQAPLIPHTLTGRTDCLSCHGPGKAVPVAVSHAGRANNTCTTCHVTGPVTATAVTAVAIPHTVTGDCLSCHGLTASWPFPANHSGRANATCITCHPSSPVSAPNISHATQNAADCLSCHSSGKIVPYPSGHTGWTNNTCALCHQTVPVPAAAVPHTISTLTECTSCHGTGTSLAYPATHVKWTMATCTLCHRLAPVSARAIPHTLTGRTNCLSCHRSGGEESIPASHAGRTVASCTLCHVRR